MKMIPAFVIFYYAHIQYVIDKSSQCKKTSYPSLRREAQKNLWVTKNRWWKESADELQLAYNRKDSIAFYAGLKAVYGLSSRGSMAIYAAHGQTLIKDQAGVLNRWAEHFNSILNRVSTISNEAFDLLPQRPIRQELDEPPTEAQTIKAVSQLSSGKAAGADGLPPPEIYKCGGQPVAMELTRLFNVIWDTQTDPQDFKDALLVHLFKHKGTRHVCDNHRGISLLAKAGKILAKIIINQLTPTVAVEEVPESQCGFPASRGTTDMLFSARQVQEKCVQQNMELFMVFVGRPLTWWVVKVFGRYLPKTVVLLV